MTNTTPNPPQGATVPELDVEVNTDEEPLLEDKLHKVIDFLRIRAARPRCDYIAVYNEEATYIADLLEEVLVNSAELELQLLEAMGMRVQ